MGNCGQRPRPRIAPKRSILNLSYRASQWLCRRECCSRRSSLRRIWMGRVHGPRAPGRPRDACDTSRVVGGGAAPCTTTMWSRHRISASSRVRGNRRNGPSAPHRGRSSTRLSSSKFRRYIVDDRPSVARKLMKLTQSRKPNDRIAGIESPRPQTSTALSTTPGPVKGHPMDNPLATTSARSSTFRHHGNGRIGVLSPRVQGSSLRWHTTVSRRGDVSSPSSSLGRRGE